MAELWDVSPNFQPLLALSSRYEAEIIFIRRCSSRSEASKRTLRWISARASSDDTVLVTGTQVVSLSLISSFVNSARSVIAAPNSRGSSKDRRNQERKQDLYGPGLMPICALIAS